MVEGAAKHLINEDDIILDKKESKKMLFTRAK